MKITKKSITAFSKGFGLALGMGTAVLSLVAVVTVAIISDYWWAVPLLLFLGFCTAVGLGYAEEAHKQ